MADRVFKVTLLVKAPDPKATDFPDEEYTQEEVQQAIADHLPDGYVLMESEIKQRVRARKLRRGPNTATKGQTLPMPRVYTRPPSGMENAFDPAFEPSNTSGIEESDLDKTGRDYGSGDRREGEKKT